MTKGISRIFSFVTDLLLQLAQYAAGFGTWVMLKFFTRLEVHDAENLREVARPFILVSNHESHLDPQLAGVALLHRPSLYPIRYMAKNELFDIPGLNVVMWLLGAFKAHRKQGIGKSLLTPTRILERRGGLVMFPEGKIIPERPMLGDGRRGAAILALTTKAMLVPISVHTPHNLTPRHFLTKRPKIVIRIGKPFYLNNLEYPDFSDENTFKATRVIMQKISDLYYRHEY